MKAKLMKRVHGWCFTTTTQWVAAVCWYCFTMTIRKIMKQEVPWRTVSFKCLQKEI